MHKGCKYANLIKIHYNNIDYYKREKLIALIIYTTNQIQHYKIYIYSINSIM